MSDNESNKPPAKPRQQEQTEIPIHDAETLTGGGRQATIRLRDQHYTLRITRQGKLILTK